MTRPCVLMAAAGASRGFGTRFRPRRLGPSAGAVQSKSPWQLRSSCGTPTRPWRCATLFTARRIGSTSRRGRPSESDSVPAPTSGGAISGPASTSKPRPVISECTPRAVRSAPKTPLTPLACGRRWRRIRSAGEVSALSTAWAARSIAGRSAPCREDPPRPCRDPRSDGASARDASCGARVRPVPGSPPTRRAGDGGYPSEASGMAPRSVTAEDRGEAGSWTQAAQRLRTSQSAKGPDEPGLTGDGATFPRHSDRGTPGG